MPWDAFGRVSVESVKIADGEIQVFWPTGIVAGHERRVMGLSASTVKIPTVQIAFSILPVSPSINILLEQYRQT